MNKLQDLTNKFSYNIEFDIDEYIYIARCAELSSLAAHGKTQEDLLKEIKIVALGMDGRGWRKNPRAFWPS